MKDLELRHAMEGLIAGSDFPDGEGNVVNFGYEGLGYL